MSTGHRVFQWLLSGGSLRGGHSMCAHKTARNSLLNRWTVHKWRLLKRKVPTSTHLHEDWRPDIADCHRDVVCRFYHSFASVTLSVLSASKRIKTTGSNILFYRQILSTINKTCKLSWWPTFTFQGQKSNKKGWFQPKILKLCGRAYLGSEWGNFLS